MNKIEIEAAFKEVFQNSRGVARQGCLGGGLIPLHTIEFNKKQVRGFGSNYKLVEIPKLIKEVNYAFIETL
jgi:hypothetical protein